MLELDAVFIACSSGELLLLHTASRSVEEVGVVSGGVAAAGWSPDGELLVLLGYNQGLLMMNKVRVQEVQGSNSDFGVVRAVGAVPVSFMLHVCLDALKSCGADTQSSTLRCCCLSCRRNGMC